MSLQVCNAESCEGLVKEKVMEFFAVVGETSETEFRASLIRETANHFSGDLGLPCLLSKYFGCIHFLSNNVSV